MDAGTVKRAFAEQAEAKRSTQPGCVMFCNQFFIRPALLDIGQDTRIIYIYKMSIQP